MIKGTQQTDTILRPKGRSRLPSVIGFGLAVAFGILLWAVNSGLTAGHKTFARSDLQFSEVRRGKLVSDVNVQGRVVASLSRTIFSPERGAVHILVNPGDRVEAGQKLATISNEELRSELQREKYRLDGLRVVLSNKRIELQNEAAKSEQSIALAELDVRAAERELARAKRAKADGALSELEVDRRADALEEAKVKLNFVRKALLLGKQSLELEVASAKLDVDRQALTVSELEARVHGLAILAPVAGVVGNLFVTDQTVVAVDAQLLSVVDLSKLQLEVEIPESYAKLLDLGMFAEITQGNQKWTGTVSALSPEVRQGLVMGRVTVSPEEKLALRQNQRASVRIVIKEINDALYVERGKYVRGANDRHAFVVSDDVVVKSPVRFGTAGVSAVEILEGLSEGDMVVVSGPDALGDLQSFLIRD